MTARTQWPRSKPSLARVTATFSELDRAAALAEIRRLRDSGLDELEIVRRTGWGRVDVRRAIGDRP